MKLTVHPGTRVAERFTILRFIAEGGMGEVYEALDEVLGESVALKFLSHRNAGDETVTRRFRREVQLARKVTHPNVCRLFDVFTHMVEIPHLGKEIEVAFVTMELLPGETLEDRVVGGGPMDETEALAIVVQMCRALAAAHDVGIVHRDFKSNNVVLVPIEGGRVRAVVTDFGLARSMLPNDPTRTPLTADQLILGTAEYMAPEQIRGEPVSPRSDLYALGVVMFEMLTGEKPYQAPNPMQLLVKRVSEPPSRPRDFRADLSPVWETVIMACLEDDPSQRPASAREVLHHLGVTDALDGLPGGRGTGDTWPTTDPAAGAAAAKALRRARWRRSPAPWLAAGVLLFGSIAFWASRGPTDRNAGNFSPERITTAPGLETDPAFAPDGERFVYSAENNQGLFSLYVRELGSTSPARRIDTEGEQVFEPDWSADGHHIVYHSRSRGGIWSLPVDDQGTEEGTPWRLTETGGRPAISPLGGHLAYQSVASPLLSDTTVPAHAPSVIRVLALDPEGRARGAPLDLTSAGDPEGGHGSPAWAPDGRHVVFTTTRRSESQIWAVAVEGGEPWPIVTTPSNAYDPVLAADGGTLYFVSRSREVKALWRVELDAGTLRPRQAARELAGLGLSSVRQPTFSRDGRSLLFAAYLTGSNLISLDLDAAGLPVGEPRPLTGGNDRYNRPVFAPGGEQIAYDHWKLGIDIDLHAMDLRSGQTRQLTHGDGTFSHASWLDDGRLVFSFAPAAGGSGARASSGGLSGGLSGSSVYLDDGSDPGSPAGPRTGAAVYLLEAPLDPGSGGSAARELGSGERGAAIGTAAEPRKLFSLGPGDDWPAAAPDGRWVAYHSSDGGQGLDLWLRQLDGGQAWRLTFHETDAGFPCWSPDSRYVAYQVHHGNSSELWLTPIDGGESRPLVTAPGHSWPYGFSPDGDRVVYSAERDGRWNLEWVSISSGEVGRLTHSQKLTGYVRYPAWSPRGDRLVFERSSTTSDLFLVRDFS